MRTGKKSAATLMVLAAMMTTAVGCSSDDSTTNLPQIEPQVAEKSPPVVGQPAGLVFPEPDLGSDITVDPHTHRLVALTRDARSAVILEPHGTRPPTRVGTVALPEPATSLSAASDGSILVTYANTVASIDTTAITLVPHPIHGTTVAKTLSANKTPSGNILLGTQGALIELGRDGSVIHRINKFVGVNSIVVNDADNHAAVLDKAQSALFDIDLGNFKRGGALRVGQGATNIAINHFGQVLATDTKGNQFFGFTFNPFLNRFNFPIADGPYAVIFDNSANVAWVTSTGNNHITSYALNTGEPVAKKTYITVQQANSIAVDPSRAAVYILSADGHGLQVVTYGVPK